MTVIALDVGGTSMKAALVPAPAEPGAGGEDVLASESWPTDRTDPVGGILDFAAHMAARAKALGRPARAAGIAIPGIVDEASGTAVHAANLNWRDVPMLHLAEERLGIPVAVGHDVRTGGLAEAVLGAGRDAGDFVFVAIGTGIAAALILGGGTYPGVSGWSGEVGHIVVRPGGEDCACGNRGCLETYASAASIARRYTALAAVPAGHSTPNGSVNVRAEDVIARAGTDETAARVWSEALDCLADSLAATTLLLDPGLFVLGGGLAQAGPALLEPLEARLAERLLFRPAPPLAVTRLGDRAAVHGAAILASRLL
ncbi:ROK family protein [Actinomadura verrucosospora]|uniref:ROK-family transcriptional regulator n=1 Tax=Actinomadura verrucosospora TaxID=46165 RepID=A0A7D3VWF6_ACTVE|nr:ROK family protein [Actinomadura verrucosospora]QKG25335.1 ROK-family transcriptional regulator [Actinomadura verrucosospora]